jgi:phospholipase C
VSFDHYFGTYPNADNSSGQSFDAANLAVDSDPPEPAHWESLCADHGVTLVWPAVIERVLRA